MSIITDRSLITSMFLQMKPGERLQLLGESVKYYAYYIGFMPGASILVTTPEQDGKTMYITARQGLQVRAILNGELYRWASTVVESYSKPSPHLHLSYPTGLQRIELRKSRRVSIVRAAQALADGQPFSNDAEQTDCHIVDISCEGAAVMVPVMLGNVGDKFILKTQLGQASSKDYKITCVIRNSRISEDATSHYVSCCHGVEFEFVDDEQKQAVGNWVAELLGYAVTVHLV